ncbi:MAG: hypothetical protein LHW64_11620, partial [Candidatus Cloacimonetes bacterium]|nr:hypothetical protein [Candidatus Cloacimonadota bacterium]MDY0230733.1 hypothetical protein [Candidatus Cloacimonadaceae bacterium]
MKKITPFLFALFICVGANAQVDRQNNSGKIDLNTKFVKSDLKTGPRSSRVEYVYETFDTEIPATWTIQNLGEGTMPGWFWKETDTRIPSIGFAIIDSDNNSAGSLTAGYLYTPFFNCTAEPNLFLEFDVRYRDVTPGGYDVFLVDIWDGSSWQNIINWDDNHGTMTEAEHIKINIAAYKNAECRVRFSYTDANEWLWFAAIDNVLISELENNDLGTNSISSKGFITAGYSTTLSVTIENRGINAQSTYDIKLVSTPAGYNETISNPGTIAAGNTLVVDFPSWTPEAVGNYTLTATVILAGDANPGNNVITSEVEVKILGFGTPVLTFETST